MKWTLKVSAKLKTQSVHLSQWRLHSITTTLNSAREASYKPRLTTSLSQTTTYDKLVTNHDSLQASDKPRLLRLIDYLRFYVPFKNFSLIWRLHHYRWRAAKFRPMLSAQGLWAGRDLYRATPAMTRGLGFSGLIWRTAPFSRLLRHTRGCGGSILTPILTGLTFCAKF
jgi:hypothetical protein